MEIVINLLLWLHFVGLAVGVGGGVALSFVGPAMQKATPDQRQALGPLRRQIFNAATGGLILLLITGPLVLWLRYGTVAGMTWWFWAKMALVVVLLGLNLMSRRALKAVEGGDMAAVAQLARNGMLSGITALLVILSAVFAFG